MLFLYDLGTGNVTQKSEQMIIFTIIKKVISVITNATDKIQEMWFYQSLFYSSFIFFV